MKNKPAARENEHAVRAEKARKSWTKNEWWYRQARQLPEVSCYHNRDHGVARVFDHATFAGRSLGYQCNICGWDKTMIVQEGQLEPCAPATELPPPTREHMRRVALGQRGAQVRAEKHAAHKAQEADDDDV